MTFKHFTLKPAYLQLHNNLATVRLPLIRCKRLWKFWLIGVCFKRFMGGVGRGWNKRMYPEDISGLHFLKTPH